MKIRLPYALNEIGQRANQEDSIYPQRGEANETSHLFLVCDGMGGHENGEVASGLVCKTFAESLAKQDAETFTTDDFLAALDAAYDALDREDPTPESQRKMGTTLTFLHLNSREAVVAHLGDSRVYHIRPSAPEPLLYKSFDHSLVNELVRAEVITPEEALTHPRRNVITRAMQPNLEQRHKADVRTLTDVAAGDYFFLCSDGVLESVSDALLIDILRRNITDEEKIEAIKSACEASSRDNFSAYLVPISEGLVADKPKSDHFAEVMDTAIAEDQEPTNGNPEVVVTERNVAPMPAVETKGKQPSATRRWIFLGLAALFGIAVGIIFLWPLMCKDDVGPQPITKENIVIERHTFLPEEDAYDGAAEDAFEKYVEEDITEDVGDGSLIDDGLDEKSATPVESVVEGKEVVVEQSPEPAAEPVAEPAAEPESQDASGGALGSAEGE